MAFELNINSVDYAAAMETGSLNITEALQANGMSMECDIFVKGSVLAVPQAGQVIEFRSDLGAREFHGRIESVTVEQRSGPNDLYYSLRCVDFTADLDDKLIQMELPEQSAGEMIRAAIGAVGRGFTVNNVVGGPTMQKQQIDLDHAGSFISRIAESVEHQWYADYDRDIHFFYITDRAAPIALIDLDIDWQNFGDWKMEEDITSVKNVIYLAGGKAKGSEPYTQDYVGDGQTRFFPLAYEPASAEGPTTVGGNGPFQDPNMDIRLGVGNAFTPNGNATTTWTWYKMKVDGRDSTAGDGNAEANTAFVCVDNWGVRLPDGVAAPGGTGDANEIPIRIEYNGMYEPVVVVEDPESIAYMRERENTAIAPSDGRHEFKFQIPELRVDSEDVIIDYGNLLLARYAMPVINASFKSWTQGWRAGQSLRIRSTRYNLDPGGEGVQFYVHSVKKSILISNHLMNVLKYDIDCSTSPFPG